MTDTHIHYKWKDNMHPQVHENMIVCDRGLWKSYLGMYDKPEPLKGKFNNCDLSSLGNRDSQLFLEDICIHWNSDRSGWQSEYIEFGKKWHDWLKQQDIQEIRFCCY